MPSNFFDQIDELSPARLTVREQARIQTNLPELEWDRYFPVQDTRTIDLTEITTTDFRPVAARREWDAPGREIPLKMGPIRKAEMTPIEDYFKIGEREMTRYFEQNGQNEQLVLQAIKGDIDSRVSGLVDAIYRRIELEAFRAWQDGQVLVTNPQTGRTIQVSMMVDASRYVTPSAWTGGESGNAYENFLDEVYNAMDYIGSVRGAKMRRTTAIAIQESAPRMGTNNVRMTLQQVQDRITQEIGSEFEIMIEERTLDTFTGAGTDTTATKLLDTGKVLFIPAQRAVGNTFFAPQVRAHRLQQVAGDFVSRNRVNVYYEKENNGKTLSVQAQLNALPFPDEQAIYVVDAGI